MGNNMRYSRGQMMTRMPNSCDSCASPRMRTGCDTCSNPHMGNSCDNCNNPSMGNSYDNCDTSRMGSGCDDCKKTRDELRGMPIAMAYVPWQEFGCTYEPMQGLHAGTIFPELEKPFYGRKGLR